MIFEESVVKFSCPVDDFLSDGRGGLGGSTGGFSAEE
jgi:hypothetical protein